MNILFAAGECVPFIKTGGLADVVGALAPVLAAKGHDVRVMVPKYSAIPQEYCSQMHHVLDFYVQLGWRSQYCGVEALEQDGVTYYFIDNEYYFRRNYIYGMGGDEYERFAFFCRACLEVLPRLGFKPEILHAHDWQSGMIPALLRIQYDADPFYRDIRTVYTIHNLQYQGIFGVEQIKDVLGIGDEYFTDDKLECYGCANFMKAALVYSDEITTVSPSYAEEIQTAYFGERLDGLLRARRNHLSGVLNGIDTVLYDPMHDPMIAANYGPDDMSGRAECKRALQRELGLEEDPDAMVIGIVSRLSSQKGLDLIDHVIGQIMEEHVQLVVLGMGESRYVNLFSWAEQQYHGRVAARFQMDNALAHHIYAGADLFLMPSQFEPCGLSQMIALRYGCVPLVRETGGLRDTVLSYNRYNNAGNGFSFFNYNAHDMLFVIRRAMRYFRDRKETWQMLQQRGMRGDYGWGASAETYLALYRSILPQQEKPVEEVHAEEVPVEVKPVAKPRATRKKEAAPEKAEEKPAAKPRATRKKEAAPEKAEEKPAAKPRATRKKEAAPEKAEEKPAAKPRATRKKETVPEKAEEKPVEKKTTRKPRTVKKDAEATK